MKKSELYHLINSLIQKSKEQKSCKDQNHPQFVTNYCQWFLKRNKLLPKSKNQKIKEIMKGFQNLDSYVDLNDIVKAIHEHVNAEMSKQQKNQLKAKQKLKLIPKAKTEPSQHVPKYIQTIQKADIVIRKTYKEGYYMQLNKCAQIVENLENTSNELNNVKYRNYANTLTYHDLLNKKFTQGKRRFQNQQNSSLDPPQSKQNQRDQTNIKSCKILQRNNPWRMLQQKDKLIGQLSRFQKAAINETSLIENSLLDLKHNHSQSKDKKHKNHFDYSKMLHSSAVYLHLILEREHYKKWALQKKNPNVDNTMKETAKTTTQNTKTTNGPSQINQIIRSTCTQQDSECKGLQKEERDQIQQFNWFQKKGIKKKSNKFRVKINEKLRNQEQQYEIGQNNNSKTDLLNKTLKSCKDTKFILNKPKSSYKQEKIYLKTQPSIHQSQVSQNIFHPNKGKINQMKISRSSICQIKQKNDKVSQNNENNTSIKKRPRHTLGNAQNLHIIAQLGCDSKIKFNQKQYIQNKQKENKEIRQKFTFKKRKVKEGVLRRITEFVNDVQYAQRNMIIQSKNCEKDLQNIQNRLQFQYGGFQQQKILNDEGALQGVRCALSKASTGLKRYNK